jgi:hypothetical protein
VKDRYIAPGGLEAMVVPLSGDGEAVREAAVVFGRDFAIARAPSSEKPGGSLILVSRGEEANHLLPELEKIPINLSKQDESVVFRCQ